MLKERIEKNLPKPHVIFLRPFTLAKNARNTHSTRTQLYLKMIRAPRGETRIVDLAHRGSVARSSHQRGRIDQQGLDGQQHLGETVTSHRGVLGGERKRCVELVHVSQSFKRRVALWPGFHVVQLMRQCERSRKGTGWAGGVMTMVNH